MSAIPFSDRELTRAWRELVDVSGPAEDRKNAHRLLLFYAVECGLKAVWLRRQGRTLFDHCDIERTGHDLRQIMKDLGVGSQFSLPENLQLELAKRNGHPFPRNGAISILHQAWRYGGKCVSPSDIECETRLQAILGWITKELTT
jgi:hypothetical protein